MENKLKLKIIMATLETDVQALSEETGEQRPVLSDIINGNGNRKALRARRKLADTLCQKITGLIVPTNDQQGTEQAT